MVSVVRVDEKEAMHRKQKKNNKQPQKLKPIEAKTYNQREYIRSIIDNDVTFCVGPAGTGKSFVAAGIASEHLHHSKIEQIVVTRPLVCAGREIGAMPGYVDEKIKPYLLPMEENLKFFLGQALYGHYMNRGQIRFEPLETMRGATFHDSYMILDEAQNCTLEQIKMFLTRMGEHSKCIINGDLKQTDLRDRSGLHVCMDKIEYIDGVGTVELDYEDIQRHSIIGEILQALDE